MSLIAFDDFTCDAIKSSRSERPLVKTVTSEDNGFSILRISELTPLLPFSLTIKSMTYSETTEGTAPASLLHLRSQARTLS